MNLDSQRFTRCFLIVCLREILFDSYSSAHTPLTRCGTLTNGRPFRILTVVDTWSRVSPVLEAGVRMSGATVSDTLDRVLGEGCAPSPWITERNSNPGRWKTGRSGAPSNSTSFGRETRGECIH